MRWVLQTPTVNLGVVTGPAASGSGHARGALDRNPTYIVATYLAGATGAR